MVEEPRVLVLWADEASPNLGVRVLARGTAELVRSVWPSAEIVFHNYGSRRPQLPIGRLRSLLWERVRGGHGMQDWLSGFDIVVDTRSGDSFTDAYGIHRLATMTAVGVSAAHAGVTVVLGPQTIGPFRTRTGRALARATLRTATLVLARDSASVSVAADLGFDIPQATTDLVFSLPLPAEPTTRDVILNVSGLLWLPNPHVDAARYRETMVAVATQLRAQGRSLTLLPHVVAAGNDDSDLAATREVGAMVDAEVIVPADLDEARRVLASARLVVASRMHACLNSLSVGVPAVALAYSDKAGPLLRDLGWAHSVDLRSAADPVAAILRELAVAESLDTTPVRREADIARHEAELALAHLRLLPVGRR